MNVFLRRKIAELPWCALLWIGSAGSIAGMALWFHGGWDLRIYQDAMRSLREGVDPYAVGQIRQIAEHARGRIAFAYVYPPLTLALLKILNHLPALLGQLVFWAVYAAGFGCQLWAGWQLVTDGERKMMRYLLPLAVFLPGLMLNETILSGNVAIPLYGAVWMGAIRGWKKKKWGWFYAAALVASAFKLPMLTLLAIPLLMGARQILKSALAAACGTSLFVLQRMMWPKEFREYLDCVQMQFSLNHDFGHGPVGIVGNVLYGMGHPFSTATGVFYLVYGAAMFAALAIFAREFRRGQLEASNWMAVLLTGTILLNPRVMTYDALAATVPMMLLTIRSCRHAGGRLCLAVTAAATACAYAAGQDNAGDALLMLGVFATGMAVLAWESRTLTFPVEAEAGTTGA